jgi:type IV pilus assembly protein PilW
MKKQSGFSLVEIFIALSIGLALMAGVLSVFVGMKTTTSETSSYGELQENGRFAISILTDDLLRQNFWGDLPGTLDAGNLISSPDPASISATDCIGDGSNNATFPDVIGHFRTLWGKTAAFNNEMGCISNAKVGSDILQIKRVLARPVTAANTDADQYYLISNANSAAIFAGNAATPAVNNGLIWEYQHHIYYVRNDTQGSNTVPVLIQGRLKNSATAMVLDLLIDGIEQIRFMYGVDTNNDNLVDTYISADNMTDAEWDNENGASILAIKIYVLARNIMPDPKYINKNVYQLGDDYFDADGDHYRRLLFTSTVTLFNAAEDIWQ